MQNLNVEWLIQFDAEESSTETRRTVFLINRFAMIATTLNEQITTLGIFLKCQSLIEPSG